MSHALTSKYPSRPVLLEDPNETSPSMSTDDIQLLSVVAQFTRYELRAAIAEAFAVGIYAVLAIMAFYTLLKRTDRNWRRNFLLLALFSTFATATFDIWLQSAYPQTILKTMLIHNPDLPFQERVGMYHKLWWITGVNYADLALVGAGDVGLLFILNDILAVWRAVSVWKPQVGSKLRFLPAVLYTLLFSCTALWITWATVSMVGGGKYSTPQASTNIMIVTSVLSILTNLVATGMMGYTAYGFVRMESNLGGRKLSGASVLIFLTESGLFYAIIQTARIALQTKLYFSDAVSYDSLDTGNIIFTSITLWVTAMYTPALILIINYGYSINDTVVRTHSD